MKLRRLTLENFRSFTLAEISGLQDLNFFGGMNGAGKSTILDAIAIAFTGTCRGAETGMHLEKLRQRGSPNKWGITVDFERGDEPLQIVRREGEGPRSSVQETVTAALEIHPARVRAAFYAGELLAIAAKDKKEAAGLIQDLCDPRIPLTPELVSACKELLAVESGDTATLAQLEHRYRVAYEMRRKVGQERAALGDTSSQIILPEEFAEAAEYSVKELRETVTDIGRKLTSLRTSRDQLVTEIATLEAGDTGGDLQQAEADQRQAKASLEALPAAAELEKDLAERKTRLEEGKALADQAAREEGEAAAARKAAEAGLKLAREALDAFKGLKGSLCPTCHQEITKDARDEINAKLQKEVLRIESEIAAAASVPKKAKPVKVAGGKGAKPTPAPLTPLGIATLEREIRDLEWSQKERRKAEADLAYAQGQIEKLSAAAAGDDVEAKKKETAAAIATKREELASIDARLKSGDAKKAALDEYLGARVASETTDRQRELLDQKHQALEDLVEALGPKGIRQGAEGKLQAFQEAMSELLRPLGFEVDLGPLLRLEDDPYVNGSPARLLSSSEQLRFGAAFAVAVSKWSGLGIVAVDDFDRMDPQTGPLMRALLQSCGSQVLIFSTIKTDEEQLRRAASLTPDIAFYLVQLTPAGTSQVEALSEVAA